VFGCQHARILFPVWVSVSFIYTADCEWSRCCYSTIKRLILTVICQLH